MSEQQKKNDFSEKLMVSASGQLKASEKIPLIAKAYVSERAKQTLDLVSLLLFPRNNVLTTFQVEKFVEEECIPADVVYRQQIGEGVQKRFNSHPPIVEDLKKRAKELGLWNMFLPKNHFKEGAGFSNLEYGLMAEYLGKSVIASTVRNVFNICMLFDTDDFRPPIALPPIPVTWKFSPNMALKHKRTNG